jgi:diketogulonate reductase-like aldo/keto reductase
MSLTTLVHANGASIPALGLGTWGGRGEECARAVAAALHAGYRHIDTAAMYGNEEDVGHGLRASGIPLADVFVTTKVWWEDLREGALQRSAEASLRRLGLHQVDLLLIHWPNRDVPLSETMHALCWTKKHGLARHIGVSNFTVALLDQAVALADEPLVTNQCEYHPGLDQSKVLAACKRHGMSFTSYSPMGRGQVLSDPDVVAIAARHGKQPAQIVLRWHMQQPGVIAIPKSTNPARIAQNIDIFNFYLAAKEMAVLSGKAGSRGRQISPLQAPDWD